MALPKPLPGQVIRYSYLWHNESMGGREEGQKDRPCVVVPITHTRPEKAERAVKIPGAIKQQLSLVDENSWIIVDELNHFEWPGPDIRPIPHTAPSRID